MRLVWKIADDDACDACKALDGREDGDGWTYDLGEEISLWSQDSDGTWFRTPRLDARGYGKPKLHPHCRCRVAIDHDHNP